jgi:putative DNA methylase
MIFKDADAAGLEPDARLTAMWLWTLGTASSDTNGKLSAEEDDVETEDEVADRPTKVSGFFLEFDAARKIAQGLGISLEKSPSIVEVKGGKARLLPVAERTKYLFGKEGADAPTAKRRPKRVFDSCAVVFDVSPLLTGGESCPSRSHSATLTANCPIILS